MSQKNKKYKRTFIPQDIGNTIKKVNRNFSAKYNKIEFIIHSKWSEITGTYFSQYSEPKNITKIPDYENDLGETIYKNQLNVSVAPAAAVEFQHFKASILEKINSYFGYKAIIDLRIQQNYIPTTYKINTKKMNDRSLSKNEEIIISNKVDEVTNEDLKKSLINLGKSIAKELK